MYHHLDSIPESVAKQLQDYPVISSIPVQWGEMDAYQHVNNVVYLRWIEVGRLDYFHRIQFDDFSPTGIGPILANTHCKYIFPVFYPDTVWLGTRVSKLLEDRFELETLIVSAKLSKPVAYNVADIVVYDYGLGAKVPAPEILQQRIFTLQPELIPHADA
ncbi:thioesterase family protein [Pontibacter sp. G13]|uniref:acyl-CoA thioesterase n=1 Tax=Pontibacter sp. G13 TaxID=3074898 RepID=UPI00288AAEB7|nr:thioesterase family protein [Pontibacter sp. G13]WNJ21363.1 thioesterase family protein [Pontibacter sp. G13]